MRMRKLLLFMSFGLAFNLPSQLYSQKKPLTTYRVHAHNDQEQQYPFQTAWTEQVGSMEADIYLVNGKILVGQGNKKDLDSARTLSSLYLNPLEEYLHLFHGHPYPGNTEKLQLVFDIKSEAVPTLNALVLLLKDHTLLTSDPELKILITGNRPSPTAFRNYPDFILFEGRSTEKFTPDQWKRIGQIGDDFSSYSKWNGMEMISKADRDTLSALVSRAHARNKPIRFWAIPDTPPSWETQDSLGIDLINSDKIEEITDHIRKGSPEAGIMPYDRSFRSGGTVIRYGDPKVENHALDICISRSGQLAFVEDRYGVSALDIKGKKILKSWSFRSDPRFKDLMSTYSGITTLFDKGREWIIWGAAAQDGHTSGIMVAAWDSGFSNISIIPVKENDDATNAIVNQICTSEEEGAPVLYAVINGNDEVRKYSWADRNLIWKTTTGVAPYGICLQKGKLYVTDWAGEQVTDTTQEFAGVPWGKTYTDPITGAVAGGNVLVLDAVTGRHLDSIKTGLHPNAIVASPNSDHIYVACGSSDEVYVIDSRNNIVAEIIPTGAFHEWSKLQGSTPNALALAHEGATLIVANGLDNALDFITLGEKASLNGKGASKILGHYPTEAYPGGIALADKDVLVTNLESRGAEVFDPVRHASQIHRQIASISIIPYPDSKQLDSVSKDVFRYNMTERIIASSLPPRKNAKPVPLPERTGEPSVFKHVIYIIKENKTYDQVYGDLEKGEGDSSLCVFGKNVTPNLHALAARYGIMDHYFASGKSSAEGHQWTDAGMVSDYVEKNVRAWFRSYPHRQEDALVYNKSGFIWNHALDHGLRVKVYGEACKTIYDDRKGWKELYAFRESGQIPNWHNVTTIARLRPIISPDYPDCDNLSFSDQQRADIFIRDWNSFEKEGNLPELLVLSLPADHSAGTSPVFPVPESMVADNDLAVGRIVDKITHSRYWDSTIIFITQDDSQSGWDHISPFRTLGLVISPFSKGGLIKERYSQVSMLRSLELILGLPPMNLMDGTARPMYECFSKLPKPNRYDMIPNQVKLGKLNVPISRLEGKARKMALLSNEIFEEVDAAPDDLLNQILWSYFRGEENYPGTGSVLK